MLRKEKDRLEKEIYILDKRKNETQKRLDDINKEMNKLQKAEAQRHAPSRAEGKEKVSQEPGKSSEKEWKTMRLKY